jgi:hypothetical protein
MLHQLHFTASDIQAGRLDSGVVVLVRNGGVNVRVLGSAETSADAAAILFAALQGVMKGLNQADMATAWRTLSERSALAEKELALYPQQNQLHQIFAKSPGAQ